MIPRIPHLALEYDRRKALLFFREVLLIVTMISYYGNGNLVTKMGTDANFVLGLRSTVEYCLVG